MHRERSYQRDDTLPLASYSTPSSRPPSIRSTSSYGRHFTNNRFIHSSGSGHHSRRHSNYSNFSTMSETSLPWTTKDIGFNAISGVLNDPAKRGQGTVKPSKTDIAPVPQASIPRIRPTDFDDYITHITPVFERYQYNKLTNHDDDNNNNTSSTYGLQPDTTPHIGGLEDINVPAHQRQSSRNPYSLPPQHILSSDSLVSMDSSSSPQQRDLPMLENVPSIYFEQDFHLENPRTFDTVCEGADIIGHNSNNPPVSTNSILQEKLSYYLDTVEVHLLQEIENRSSSFFEALSNLQALHQQTLDCITQIHTIRSKMKQLEKTECKDGLDVIRLQVKKRNLERLYCTIVTIKEIVSVQPTIQILLGHGDYFGALDLIHATRSTLHQQDTVDWHSIHALVNLSTQLDEMEKAVSAMMQHDFLSMLLTDLTQFMNDLDVALVKGSFLSLSITDDDDDDNDTTSERLQLDDDLPVGFKDRLTSSMMGLISTNALTTCLQDYKDQLCVELTSTIRKHYPLVVSQDDGDSQGSGTGLAKRLKSMPFDQFFQMLLAIFGTLLQVIQRAAVYDQLMMQMIDTCLERLNDQLKEQCELAKKQSNEVVYTVSDLAHVRCGKLIGFRGDQNALLNPTDFYRLSNVLKTFIRQSEMYCGRPCFGLRGTVLSQQKAFVDHFHMERVKQEAQLIENDQWMATEVPLDFQRIVDRICDSNRETTSHQEPEKATKLLMIHGQSYYVVGCTLLIIKLFEDYLQCVLNLKDMATDIMQKLLELLKLFNSRVCQVILGAGAMRSAGLKNISAKHLALASQSVGVMMALTPSLKDCMACYVPAKHDILLSEFDRAVNDFKDHQKEIHVKLVAIMNERFSVHIKAMQVIQWDTDEISGKQANVYMETLVKETMTLHKVLSKYLPSTDLQFIMDQVFESFTTQLSQVIRQTPIHTEEGKARIHKDASYFTRRLSSLQGVDGPSHQVLDAVESISISHEEKTDTT
ncbi:Vps54-like protein-domain-containing protein [Halteromyces radiatus]|uniref:Vps54-like protein-domain-containing protein n=1 Tax=Halteromyces radiatus TaxID=101107 RepID=UPI00222086F7|nr:Vps54-like protein-domain-containing protein [Halteromyces radiatus]KAI8078750.1 Vps54-like protein-domain-containing protein [Halteromyces radiatus]